jgi:hypothetical protein
MEGKRKSDTAKGEKLEVAIEKGGGKMHMPLPSVTVPPDALFEKCLN